MKNLDQRIAIISRRAKIKELCLRGYNVIDVARYFELPTSCIINSIKRANFPLEKVINADMIKSSERENILLQASALLQERNQMLTGLDLETIINMGFWRVPSSFNQNQDENSLQEELRSIGITKSEILLYLGSGNINVMRAQNHPIFKEQAEIANLLTENQWSVNAIVEFTGISIGKYYKRNEEDTRHKGERKGQKDAEKKFKNICKDFENENLTIQEIAEKNHVSRRTVYNYLKKFSDDSTVIKNKLSKKKDRAGKDSETIKNNLLTVLDCDENDNIVFKNGYSLEKTANKFNYTTVTVSKHKKEIENDKVTYLPLLKKHHK